jgi:hypothetical protein
MAKRTGQPKDRNRQAPPDEELELDWDPIPSAQTLFRTHLLTPETDELLAQATRNLRPLAWARDRKNAERIERATTAEELLDLIPLATGLARPVWHRRMREFGPEVVPLMAERLQRTVGIEDEDGRARAYEQLIGALRWKGEAGAGALLERFDELGDNGKSLACVALGLLGAEAGGDAVWGFYERVKGEPDERHSIGALWGLVDMGDPRAADALAELLWEMRYFYEVFALTHKGGDGRAVVPLMLAMQMGGEEMQGAASAALSSVAHRIGRESLVAELSQLGSEEDIPAEAYESLASTVLDTPPDLGAEYFRSFYRGLRPDEVDLPGLEKRLTPFDSAADEPFAQRQEPHERPGRNDPCWCGSGKKYKHCHWREDRESE